MDSTRIKYINKWKNKDLIAINQIISTKESDPNYDPNVVKNDKNIYLKAKNEAVNSIRSAVDINEFNKVFSNQILSVKKALKIYDQSILKAIAQKLNEVKISIISNINKIKETFEIYKTMPNAKKSLMPKKLYNQSN